jgi:hypothetical protein
MRAFALLLCVLPGMTALADTTAAELVHDAITTGPLAGCTLSHPPSTPYIPVISGHCLGHTFANPEPDAPQKTLNACQVDEGADRITVTHCLVDGKLTQVFEVAVKQPSR